ncbi:MAG TPA: pitrilysin family protein [Verrucomicrobiota bacterium]|nr:peptidase M16 [Verrucomicrobiales bacterium]HRI11813.1 pitrilysin family protein [Verrucomicrobiota bacterium]
MYEVTRLENGLTVLTASMPHMASVSVGVWVGVGGRHEPARWNGISHFIEHMLFKGTRRRNAAQISQAVEGIGGYLNAFTDEEHTCFYARAQRQRLPDLLDVLLDMFLESQFAPGEIAKERDVIKEEIAMYLDQPAEQVHDLLNALQFPHHPLGRPVIGTPRTLDLMRRRDFCRYVESRYVTGATVITAAGNVRHRELVRLVERRARGFRVGERPHYEAAPQRSRGPSLKLTHKATEQTHLSLGIRTCSRHDPRRHALRLVNVILGENMSSRLFQVVREQHGLTYNIHSAVSFWDDCGDLVVSAGLDTSEVGRTLKLIRRELDRLAESPPSRAEFARARDYLLGQHALQLESAENHMMLLGEYWLGYGRVPSPREFGRRMAALKAADVCASAKEFFRPENFSLAVVSPRKRMDDLAALLTN